MIKKKASKKATKKKVVRKKTPVKKRSSKRTSVKTKKRSKVSSSKKRGSSASSRKKSPRRKTKELPLHKDGSEQFTTSDVLFENIVNYGGRPTKHSIPMENRICGLISMGYSLSKICSFSDMPNISTVFLWLNDKTKSGFLDKYTHAREMQTEIIEDGIIDIADSAAQPVLVKGKPVIIDGKPIMAVDNASVQHARLRIDTRTRHMEVTKPKKWGKHTDLGESIDQGLLELMDAAAKRVSAYKNKTVIIDNESGGVVDAKS